MRHPGFTKFVEYAPGRIVSNADLPIPFENITERTGIRSRNFVHREETIVSLGLTVAHKLFDSLGITGKDCGGLVLASTGDSALALLESGKTLAGQLGIEGSVDATNYACSGFPAAVAIARRRCIESNKHILVLTVEILSRMLDFRDEGTAILFGDRSAATTVHRDGPLEIVDARAVRLNDERCLITVLPVDDALDDYGEVEARNVIRLQGKELYRMVPGRMVQLALSQEMLKRHGQPVRIVHHQANGKFGSKMRKILERDGITNIDIIDFIQHMGNVASSSIPSTLAQIQDDLQVGELVACPSVGGGPDMKEGLLSEGIVLFRPAGKAA